MNEQLLEKMIKDVLTSMNEEGKTSGGSTPVNSNKKSLTTADYPIQEKHPDLIKTPTGRKLDEITMDKVMSGEVTSDDFRVPAETLEMQAQVAESAGRKPLARNLRRSAELTKVPDARVLEIYNALRPNRSTKEELLEIADELENQYQATINAAFVREAAEVYTDRDILKTD